MLIGHPIKPSEVFALITQEIQAKNVNLMNKNVS